MRIKGEDMLSVVIFFFLVSIFIYCLLGGADFGAGIIELTSGRKTKELTQNLVSEAMAPIWEANHVWLIIAVVILFNGFPPVYSQLLIYLSIPLILMLVGIILRGSAFTFRHYDAVKDSSQEVYSRVFRYSSLIVPFFFGLIVGAIISGKITTTPSTFYEGYIAPWFNLFSFATGVFVVSIFSHIAAVFLISESNDPESIKIFISKSKRAIIATVLFGGLVFISSLIEDVNFFQSFIGNGISLAFIIIATLTLPFIWKAVGRGTKWPSRILAGAQLFFILAAFYAVYFPVLVRLKNGSELTFYNAAAPEATLKYLAFALIAGSLFIFPSLFFMLRVFKAERHVAEEKGENIF